MWQERLNELKKLISEGKTNKEIGEYFGVKESTAKRAKNKLRIKGLLPKYKLDETPDVFREFETVETRDSLSISLNKTRISTIEELLEYCKVDLTIWEVDRFILNKWEVGAKNLLGQIEVEPLFQVKAYLKKRVQVDNLKTLLEDLKSDAKNYAPQYERLVEIDPNRDKKYCLEISLSDLHYAKLVWGEECGEDYDSDIAENLFFTTIEELLNKSKPYHPHLSKILFIVGNDLLNADNYEMTTTKGTPQHCDTRHQKMFKRVRMMMQKAIERLSIFADVDVLIVPGNHDEQSSFYIGDVLEVAFEKNENVSIDNAPTARKYYQFGKNLLMFTHGNNEKHTDLPLIMATERPELWGDTKFREVHLGHLHKKSEFNTPSVNEFHGVRVRILPSLCPSDDWFSKKGYVGNIRSSEAYIWHEDHGLEGYFVYNP